MDSNFSDSQQSQSNQPIPDNNLVWAILSLFFCCWPVSIYAIVRSTKVNTLWIQGDYDGAKKAADDAKKWSIYSAIAAAIFWILYILFFVVIGVAVFSQAKYQ